MDAVFKPGIDSPFSPNTFDDLSMERSVKDPFLLDEEEDKETPPPATGEIVRHKEPTRLQRSLAFGARLENVPDYVCRNLFH